MKKCHPRSRRHAMHMNTSPTHGPVPPINQHSASADYTLPLRNQAGRKGHFREAWEWTDITPYPVRTKGRTYSINMGFLPLLAATGTENITPPLWPNLEWDSFWLFFFGVFKIFYIWFCFKKQCKWYEILQPVRSLKKKIKKSLWKLDWIDWASSQCWCVKLQLWD